MEKNSSSMSKAVSPKSEHSEESGWTAYFQDFSNNNSYNNNNNNNNNHEESLISCSSSLVSDAASYAAWKMISLQRDHHHVATTAGPSIPGGGSPPPKKLSFKKTRTKEICSDESLEDTASSPANSPKIGDLKRPAVDMKTKYMDDHLIQNNSLGKRGGTSEYYSEVQDEERSIVDFNEKNDCIDLKKRGLCLVPLSMLVNYLG